MNLSANELYIRLLRYITSSVQVLPRCSFPSKLELKLPLENVQFQLPPMLSDYLCHYNIAKVANKFYAFLFHCLLFLALPSLAHLLSVFLPSLLSSSNFLTLIQEADFAML